MGSLMPLSFPSTTFFFNRPIDHQSTSNDRLKPVLTTGLVNMHIDRSIANLGFNGHPFLTSEFNGKLIDNDTHKCT